MSSYISRLLKAQSASKRLISNLTQRDGKLSSLLRRLGLQWQGGAAAAPQQRPISTTQVQKSALIADDQLVTGIQKREMLLAKQGCEDPWGFTKVIRRGSGRENDPTVVPSAFDARLVGCLCLDDRLPKWMWIEKDEGPKRCECGHYFILKNVPPV
ncbi:cytochrome c oxidase subunit 5B, mitochondrial [Drosophila sechellia]|uniref:Cytochrome c oxidase subunit Vb n=2 Tax=melanogaster subgroup TaxID=32351 RepID=A2TDV7_DROSI|nr:cytochrome c oxidase subunit 5B, mitochondrial [Drosophila sechellia]XP_002078390.1 cytochrome c oxidase subunit 5B, mitochondrial [Drosophila simulans]ABM88291.1 mitochondrial cytochrome c oxidase subunit 5B isoform 2 [Drosophila simulans]ABM88292.1 mitochondrial cytochrome c oxidase subunit 5B isoform 2 [Drosophila simulans]ABM88293.1 mitochondrial cytochrome c oxidase subunit 5B isoform 2 [Drosophila simulans]ABM88294.1 mitochondrial cytochrome c oxidase subunit 5B isoform 2 [Drosophila 